jgi:hypothetical protein
MDVDKIFTNMAFIWVQVWAPLPTSNSGFIMGEAPSRSQTTSRNFNMAHSTRQEPMQPSPSDQYEGTERRKELQETFPQANYSNPLLYSPPQQQQPPMRADSFSMNSLGSALPDLSYQSYGQLSSQRYAPGASSSNLLYQLPNTTQFVGAQGINSSGNSPYSMPYQGQYPGIYATGHGPPHMQSSTSPTNQFYHNQAFQQQQQQQQQQQNPPYFMQPNQYTPQGQMYSQLQSQYGQRNNFVGDPRLQSQQRANEYLGINYASGVDGRSSSIGK